METPSRIIFLMGLTLLTTFQACRCSCDCYKSLGCVIATARTTSSDSLIVTETYCSTTNFYENKAIQDSVSAFMNRYTSDTLTLYTRDSIFYQKSTGKMSCAQTDRYTREDFTCDCVR